MTDEDRFDSATVEELLSLNKKAPGSDLTVNEVFETILDTLIANEAMSFYYLLGELMKMRQLLNRQQKPVFDLLIKEALRKQS